MKRSINSNSILSKKIIYYNILIVFTLCLLFFITFSFFYVSQQQNQFAYTAEITADNKMEMMEQALIAGKQSTTQLRFDENIIAGFSEAYWDTSLYNYFALEPSYQDAFLSAAIPYLITQDSINRICVYNEKRDFMYAGDSVDTDLMLEHISPERLYELEQNFSNQVIFFDVEQSDPLSSEGDGDGYISVIQQINDLDIMQGRDIAYVEVQLSFEKLKQRLGDVHYTQLLQILYDDTVFLEMGENNTNENVVAISRDLDNGFTVRLQQYDTMGATLSITMIISVGLVLVLIVFLLYQIQKRLVRKITQPLIELCQQVQTMDLDYMPQLPTQDLDEIENLNKSFVHLFTRMQHSVADLVAEKTGKLNAQMLALQAHIDPHFIHNTLSIVSSLIDDEQPQKAQDILQKLSDMIRYGANYSEKEDTLEYEIEQIENYLALIKIKYEDDFTFYIADIPQAKSIRVPKFILQPLIENALNHSLKKSEYPWTLAVTNQITDSTWQISISDNGVGIEEDRAQMIKQQVRQLNDSSAEDLLNMLQIGGYSMMNILIRLYLSYNDDVIFDIKKNSQGGTTVTLGGRRND